MASWQDLLRIGAVALGVDMGTHAMKVAELRRTGRGIELTHYGIAPTPPGAVANGMILDRPAASGALRMLLRASGIRGRRAVISVTGQNVLARILRLPPIPADEVKQAIRWEAERHLPFPVEEAVLDAQVVGEVTDDGQRQLEVLLAAAPETVALTCIETVEEAGLQVEAVELSALAMVRALSRREHPGVVAMVNLGASTTEVAVVRGGVPQFTRTIAEGVEGLAEGGETAIIEGRLDAVVSQLRRSFDFYRVQYGRAQIDQILLCGGGARADGVDRHLALEMEIPVAVGTPLEEVHPGSHLDSDTVRRLAPQLVTAIGLALRTHT
ncbi:MAG: type IV pilus assembly protein PilM [Armatimonadota bacterium]|nr:type IV pilus assembly protein PilM [Armatimonadota bacterium]MDR7451937.1 type IV pilus assembly protein PilM [Armatimonadota bacterium]MDR7466619.1 type IV pilus assembly protein PilM [Armatimonadota bacterium]MDR7492907.1 type IV pilus assembly protein PilM [Armatimonadota bacterium]MDR7500434.1 type IV pilus assembly protein PilM [Armatimonadota bacterium]